MKHTLMYIFLVFLIAPTLTSAQDNWQQLFNGSDLNGWTQKGGEAEYTVEKGVIVGTAVPNTPNSFLITDQEFGDFILEFEVYMDSQLNSGVQIRSKSTPDYLNGRVHGYQVELDPTHRAWSGGIYDEARRGWLYPLSRNPKASSSLMLGQWNTIRIEAISETIHTWVNGVHSARLVDDLTPNGFIGLQVHNILPGQNLEGAQVKWRNLRILTDNPEEHRSQADPEVQQVSYLKNELTHWEKSKGWRLLWDGTSPNGWRGAKLNHFPESGWVISDGVLTIEQTDGGEATGPGDIVTIEQFSDFELELEFMITEGANSGIKYFVDPELNKSVGSAIGTEFQILDDQNHPDAKEGVAGNRTLGSLYDLIPASNIEYPYRDKPFYGIGKWNKARIVSKDGHVEHWLNNIKVVEYDRYSKMFSALVAYSKYRDWEAFGKWPQGHILLQDHGNEVHFRSIKIREF